MCCNVLECVVRIRKHHVTHMVQQTCGAACCSVLQCVVNASCHKTNALCNTHAIADHAIAHVGMCCSMTSIRNKRESECGSMLQCVGCVGACCSVLFCDIYTAEQKSLVRLKVFGRLEFVRIEFVRAWLLAVYVLIFEIISVY